MICVAARRLKSVLAMLWFRLESSIGRDGMGWDGGLYWRDCDCDRPEVGQFR